jgi:hypothetical protein
MLQPSSLTRPVAARAAKCSLCHYCTSETERLFANPSSFSGSIPSIGHSRGPSTLSRGFVMTMISLSGALKCAALAIGALIAPHLAAAEDLVVQYDQARLLRLPEPAANIIVGNPSIADVTLQSTELLIITGKTFGVTNLIILDKNNKIILNQRLMVKSDDQKVVSLQRGISTTTYACVPKCEPVLKVGDEPNHFSEVAKAGQQKMKISADSGGEEVAN